jgi:hypothetical protein
MTDVTEHYMIGACSGAQFIDEAGYAAGEHLHLRANRTANAPPPANARRNQHIRYHNNNYRRLRRHRSNPDLRDEEYEIDGLENEVVEREDDLYGPQRDLLNSLFCCCCCFRCCVCSTTATAGPTDCSYRCERILQRQCGGCAVSAWMWIRSGFQRLLLRIGTGLIAAWTNPVALAFRSMALTVGTAIHIIVVLVSSLFSFSRPISYDIFAVCRCC